MTAYIMFLRCVSYLIFVGVLMFIAGRFLPKSLFHHHRFPFRVFASEKRGTIYVHLGVRKWLATRCACANRIGMSTACSKASRPLSISTCSVRAATKHSACWPSATICDRERYTAEKRRLAAQKWTYVQDYADAKTAVVQEILAHISALPLTSIQ